MIGRSVTALLMTTLASACTNDGSDASSIAELGDITGEQAELKTEAANAIVDDSTYRRTYGVADMNVHDCVTVTPDGALTGDNCPSAFVVFGPYIFAPGNSDVSVSFDFEASTKVVLASDIVSSVAKNFHAALGDQEVAEGESRKIAFKVRIYQPAEGVESRLWVRGDADTRFRITNLGLDVR